jgi:hypothetical protein
MKLSFDDEESFMEAARSLSFNIPRSDSNTDQRVGTQERSEDIGFNNPSDDPITTLQRMGRSSCQDIGEESR